MSTSTSELTTVTNSSTTITTTTTTEVPQSEGYTNTATVTSIKPTEVTIPISKTEESDNDGASIGAIVGGCTGAVVVIVVIVAVVVLLMRRRNYRRKKNARPPPTAPSRDELDPHAGRLATDNPPACQVDQGSIENQELQLYVNVDKDNKPSEDTDPSIGLDGYLSKSTLPRLPEQRRKGNRGESKGHKNRNHHQNQQKQYQQSRSTDKDLQLYKNVEMRPGDRHGDRLTSMPYERAPVVPGTTDTGYVNGRIQTEQQNEDIGNAESHEVTRLKDNGRRHVSSKDNSSETEKKYENIQTGDISRVLSDYENVPSKVSEQDITVTLQPDELYENP